MNNVSITEPANNAYLVLFIFKIFNVFFYVKSNKKGYAKFEVSNNEKNVKFFECKILKGPDGYIPKLE